MNKNTFNTFWLIAILSAIFVSCNKEDTTLGENFQSSDGTFSHFVLGPELEIELATLLKDDSLVTSTANQFYVGSSTDNTFGTTTVHSFFQLGLTIQEPAFPDDLVVDSIKIRLDYDRTNPLNRDVQGSATGATVLEVKELDQFFEQGVVYFNSERLRVKPQVLARATLQPDTDPSEFISLDLPTAYGQFLMDNAKGQTSINFLNRVPGIALMSGAGSGLISAFSVASNNTRIRVFYTANGTNSQYDFDLSNTLQKHISVETDYTGSTFGPLATQKRAEISATNNQVGIASGNGQNLLVNFKNLQAFLDTTPNIIINRAVLTLKPNPNTIEEIYSIAPRFLAVYQADEQGNFVFGPNGGRQAIAPDASVVFNSGTTLFGYSNATASYEMDMTHYFQEVALGVEDLNSLLISASVIANGINYNANYKNAAFDAQDISFKLYYSRL